ncbi:hypothetical protein ACR6HW_09645 [Fusibacter sp. JL298sf-3]
METEALVEAVNALLEEKRRHYEAIAYLAEALTQETDQALRASIVDTIEKRLQRSETIDRQFLVALNRLYKVLKIESFDELDERIPHELKGLKTAQKHIDQIAIHTEKWARYRKSYGEARQQLEDEKRQNRFKARVEKTYDKKK